mmetsp:Transcript_4631/g.13973  ORF Transcript_4631/g.13973 Transcript_4631/m.13973 type:complete len:236 (+) Transcript_4631:457-1164(+)
MADDLSATIEQLRGMGLLHVGDARLSSDDIARMQVELLRPPQRRHAQEFEDVHDGSGMGDHSDSSHARGGAYSSGSLADTNNGDGSPSAYSRSLSTGVGQTQSHGSPAPAKPSASAGQLSSKQQQRQQQPLQRRRRNHVCAECVCRVGAREPAGGRAAAIAARPAAAAAPAAGGRDGRPQDACAGPGPDAGGVPPHAGGWRVPARLHLHRRGEVPRTGVGAPTPRSVPRNSGGAL